MSDESAEQVWLYEDGGWTLADDPVPWSQDGGDVRAKYAEAGYTTCTACPIPSSSWDWTAKTTPVPALSSPCSSETSTRSA